MSNDLMSYVLKKLNDGATMEDITADVNTAVNDAKAKYDNDMALKTKIEDATTELYASVAEYINIVYPDVKYDVNEIGKAVSNYIKTYFGITKPVSDLWSDIFGDDAIFNWNVPTNADHRKQRGRTAPNGDIAAWDDKNYFEKTVQDYKDAGWTVDKSEFKDTDGGFTSTIKVHK